MVEKTMTDEILSFYQERIKNLQTTLSDIIDTADLDNQIISDPIQYAEKLRECAKQAKEVLSDNTVKGGLINDKKIPSRCTYFIICPVLHSMRRKVLRCIQ